MMSSLARTRLWAALSWAVFLVLLVAALPQPAFGQGFSRLSVPLEVDIDGQPVRAQMYFKVEMRSYNLPFDQFAASNADKAEAMFAKAVRAVRQNDVAAFGAVWTAPDQMKSTGQSMAVKLSDNGPGGWMKVVRSMFDFGKLTVVAELLIGPDTMFIWDSQTKNGVLRRAFYVGFDKEGRQRLSAPGDDKPVEALILNAFEAARTAPEAYKPLPNINLRYQYPIPLAGPGDTGAHPVFLVFDGTPVDFPLGDEGVKAPTPVLNFYRSADLAKLNGKKDDFAASFTPKSQEKVRQWQAAEDKRLEQMKKQTEPAKPQTEPPPSSAQASIPPPKTAPLPKGASVKFVVSADPVFLVFQASGPGNGWKPSALAYTYVVRDGASFKIANFGFGNTLDEFLENTDLFDKRILKPATAKPGALKTPAAGKPAAVKR